MSKVSTKEIMEFGHRPEFLHRGDQYEDSQYDTNSITDANT